MEIFSLLALSPATPRCWVTEVAEPEKRPAFFPQRTRVAVCVSILDERRWAHLTGIVLEKEWVRGGAGPQEVLTSSYGRRAGRNPGS